MPRTRDAMIRRSSVVSLLNSRILVTSRAETLKIIVTKRTHVVTLTAGSLVSPLNRVPIEPKYVKQRRVGYLKREKDGKESIREYNMLREHALSFLLYRCAIW